MTYWFAEENPQNVVKKIDEADSSQAVWSTNPMVQQWVRNSIAYYSSVLEPSAWDSSLTFMGDQGELVRMIVPMTRSIIRQLVAIITKQKLDFKALVEKSGYGMSQTVRLADALTKQLLEDQDVDLKYEFGVEQSIVCGAGFYGATWRTDKGRPFAKRTEDGYFEYAGEVNISTPTVWDVMYDYSIQFWGDVEWARIRKPHNRYNLMAQFPELRDYIANLPPVKDWRGPFRASFTAACEDDYVYTYELYHKPTPALPEGRMIMYADQKTVMFDGPNYYETIPYEMAKPEPISGTGFGYALMSSLLPAQEMFDTLVSAIATNQSTFAVQNVTVPRGANINVQEVLGMNFLQYTPMPGVPSSGKPEPLNLTSTPAEVFKFVDMLKGFSQELSNINSALRGEPPPQVSSGTAIATLTSTAIEAITSSAKASRIALKKTMYHAISAYQRFASVGHLVSMTGKNNEMVIKEFKGEDLQDIKGYSLSETNPLLQTLAGRLEVADKLLQTGMIQNTNAYFQVLEGEKPTKMFDKELSEEDLIDKENESLTRGAPVRALSTDDHPAHIACHSKLLNDPEIRMSDPRVKPIMDHILEHYELSQSTDPQLMAMVKTGKIPEGGIQSSQAPQSGPLPQQADGVDGSNMPTAAPAQPANDLLGRG
jgi:hypothetical protein